MRRVSRVLNRAIVGYAVILLCLGGGMFFAVQRLAQLSGEQVAALRGREYEITVAERLRWKSEVIVSTGRGYLLAADPGLAVRLRLSEDAFNETLRSLKRQTLGAAERARVVAVEQAALGFLEKQRVFIEERQRDVDSTSLVRRFEEELRPRYVRLGVALDELVDERERALDDFYEQGTRARARAGFFLFGFMGLLFLLAGGMIWYLARVISTSLRKEESAHDEARRAVAARDEMMGVVAHDLRNPLSTIALNASLLQKPGEFETRRRQAQTIERVAGRMKALISAMLDAATLESGHLPVAVRPCELDVLVQDASELLESLAASRQMGLTRRVEVPAGLVCLADGNRVLQVLSNLFGNALKFTPDGGTVGFVVELGDGVVHFAVSDTGPGIAPEHQPFLFERFWMNEREGHKGTGLGLFIARGIVQRHGGRLWVESAPGKGATFHFTLPMAA